MAPRLQERVAFISGAGSGMGRAAAVRFAREAPGSPWLEPLPEPDAQETADQIVAEGGEAIVFHVDVTSDLEVKAAAEATLARFGRLDVLLACAGVAAPVQPTTVERLHRGSMGARDGRERPRRVSLCQALHPPDAGTGGRRHRRHRFRFLLRCHAETGRLLRFERSCSDVDPCARCGPRAGQHPCRLRTARASSIPRWCATSSRPEIGISPISDCRRCTRQSRLRRSCSSLPATSRLALAERRWSLTSAAWRNRRSPSSHDGYNRPRGRPAGCLLCRATPALPCCREASLRAVAPFAPHGFEAVNVSWPREESNLRAQIRRSTKPEIIIDRSCGICRGNAAVSLSEALCDLGRSRWFL